MSESNENKQKGENKNDFSTFSKLFKKEDETVELDLNRIMSQEREFSIEEHKESFLTENTPNKDKKHPSKEADQAIEIQTITNQETNKTENLSLNEISDKKKPHSEHEELKGTDDIFFTEKTLKSLENIFRQSENELKADNETFEHLQKTDNEIFNVEKNHKSEYTQDNFSTQYNASNDVKLKIIPQEAVLPSFDEEDGNIEASDLRLLNEKYHTQKSLKNDILNTSLASNNQEDEIKTIEIPYSYESAEERKETFRQYISELGMNLDFYKNGTPFVYNFRNDHNLESDFFIEGLVLKLINEKITKEEVRKILKENGKNVKDYNNFIKMILMRRIELAEMENIKVKNQNVNNYIDHEIVYFLLKNKTKNVKYDIEENKIDLKRRKQLLSRSDLIRLVKQTNLNPKSDAIECLERGMELFLRRKMEELSLKK